MSDENNTPLEDESVAETVDLTPNQEPPVDQPAERSETDVLNQQISVLNDQLLRALAEFDNYRKRSQREIQQIIENASEKLITDLLPVVDDLERGLKAAKELDRSDVRVQNFIQGLEIIHGKLMKTLQNRGLKAMESIGQPLDPHLHDALMQIEQPSVEPNTVVDEHEKGYFLNDKVIRHAKVIVSKGSDPQD